MLLCCTLYIASASNGRHYKLNASEGWLQDHNPSVAARRNAVRSIEPLFRPSANMSLVSIHHSICIYTSLLYSFFVCFNSFLLRQFCFSALDLMDLNVAQQHYLTGKIKTTQFSQFKVCLLFDNVHAMFFFLACTIDLPNNDIR